MPRRPSWPPRVYPKSGCDYLRVWVAPGRHKDYRLGPTGSEESRREYGRLVAELEANGRVPRPDAALPTVAEVVAPYLALARGRYDPRHFHRVKVALLAANDLYGHTQAAGFSPARLEAVRARLVEGGYCRKGVNAMTSVVRQCFRWAAVRGLVPVAVADGLRLLPALKRRETRAPDHPKVRPADPAAVEATLPHLPPIVADMVRVQLWTGMRPGEVCALRPCDVRRPWKEVGGVPLWLYTLDEHKTDWKGCERHVVLGPRAQGVLAPYLANRDPGRHVFSPYEVRVAFHEAHGRRVHFGRTRFPGTRYSPCAYACCVRKACRRAGVPPWSPNRLRHLFATLVQTLHDRESARCVLGHATQDTTAVYADWLDRAALVIARMG